MRNRRKKRNSPITTLIRNYTNKKSGKVSESRDEIKWRFNALDWKDQKKILNAFLESGISDREWAYSKVLDYWDDSFLPKIKELWETYHEYKCSWSIIRYFPLDYIAEHIDDFTGSRDYFFICLRLAQNKDFTINRSKLSNTDYLALLFHTGRYISEEDARDTLFSIVHDYCLEETYITKLEHLGEGKYRNVVTPLNYRDIRLAFYYIVNLQEFVVAKEFKDWNQTVEETIYNSPEFKAIDRNECPTEYEYNRRRVEIAKIYAFKALDDKYKLPSDSTVEQMRQAYEQRLEWERILREQSAEGFSVFESEFFDIDSDEEDSFPF